MDLLTPDHVSDFIKDIIIMIMIKFLGDLMLPNNGYKTAESC